MSQKHVFLFDFKWLNFDVLTCYTQKIILMGHSQ